MSICKIIVIVIIKLILHYATIFEQPFHIPSFHANDWFLRTVAFQETGESYYPVTWANVIVPRVRDQSGNHAWKYAKFRIGEHYTTEMNDWIETECLIHWSIVWTYFSTNLYYIYLGAFSKEDNDRNCEMCYVQHIQHIRRVSLRSKYASTLFQSSSLI